jgi:hypothetical protein
LARNCQTLDAAPSNAAAVVAAAAGIQPAGHPYVDKSSTAIGTFDQTDLLGSSCPSDQSVSIGGGRSIVLPFSQLCSPAQALGNILVALTALSCIGIVFLRSS